MFNWNADHPVSWYLAYRIIGWVIIAIMILVVLRRQLAPGASLAWIGITLLHPYIGLTLYMLVGEARLGPHRKQQYQFLITKSRLRTSDSSAPPIADKIPAEYQPMVLQAGKISGMPVLKGNEVEFLGNSEEMAQKLIDDIEAAKSSVKLLYYIFACDGTGRRVADALCRAVTRGVVCQVLVDAVASRRFLGRWRGLGKKLRHAGVQVEAALRVQLIQRRLPRMDLRNHRKMAVIDHHIGYAGSHNLIDADYGGRRGAPWVDLTGRFKGPMVDELEMVFDEDWAFESGQEFKGPAANNVDHPAGEILMQVAPTGPSAPGDTYRRLLLAAIQSARSKLILTTPYFVPDETTLVALMMAADRGVAVSLLLPKNPDHFFTAAAGRAHFSRLMEAGVKIFLYRPGLLHSKSATVDDAFCLFGSANLDVRSFNLNFELSVLLYGHDVTDRLRAIQSQYLADCDALDPVQWEKRSAIKTYGDGAISLLSPLL
jgi:cardiolipin synthase